MRILLVVAYFIPEIGSAAHIYFDLAKAFAKQGHDVDVITSYPREFNLNKEDQGRKFPLEEEVEGVTIYRCKHPANRDNILSGLEHFYLPYYYFKKYRESVRSMMFACTYRHFPTTLQRRSSSMTEPSVLNFQISIRRTYRCWGIENPVMIKILEHIEGEA